MPRTSAKARLMPYVMLAFLAAPWLWLMWRTRHGAERPLVVDVLIPFFIVCPVTMQTVAEIAVKTRRPGLLAIASALVVLSVAGVGLRFHDAWVSAGLLCTTVLITAGSLVINWLFERRRRD